MKRWVITLSFLSNTRPHPRYFAWLLRCTRNSLDLLALLRCFLPSLFLLTAPYLLFDFLKQLEDSRSSLESPFSYPRVQHQKKESSQLFSPFHTYESSSRKESFFQIFSSSCFQLEARVILALITPRICV